MTRRINRGAPVAPATLENKDQMKYKEKEYLRVTEILNPFSGYALIDPDVLQRAADRGTKVHEHLNCILKDVGLWGLDQCHRGYIDSARYFIDEIKDVHATEQRFFDDNLMITGQCDLICEYQSKKTLVDWKTSYAINKTWNAQGSAYANMARSSGYNIEQVIFVKLSKDGKDPQIVYVKEDYEEFITLYKIYNKYLKGKTK